MGDVIPLFKNNQSIVIDPEELEAVKHDIFLEFANKFIINAESLAIAFNLTKEETNNYLQKAFDEIGALNIVIE